MEQLKTFVFLVSAIVFYFFLVILNQDILHNHDPADYGLYDLVTCFVFFYIPLKKG